MEERIAETEKREKLIGLVTRFPRRDTGLRAGDYVEVDELGDGIVIGFTAYSGEPEVYFYSQQQSLCVGRNMIRRL